MLSYLLYSLKIQRNATSKKNQILRYLIKRANALAINKPMVYRILVATDEDIAIHPHRQLQSTFPVQQIKVSPAQHAKPKHII